MRRTGGSQHPSIMYAEDTSVRNARAQYFAANGFSDAGYSDRWVKLGQLGPIPIALPNTAARKRAVPLHDLHHVATGYATSWIGEAEISAWEIAAGCTDYWAAWVLNTGAFSYGVVLAPRRTYRAFMRGRRSRTLYYSGWHDGLLEISVAELRRRLALDGMREQPSWRDRLAFAGWVLLAMAPALIAIALAVAWLV